MKDDPVKREAQLWFRLIIGVGCALPFLTIVCAPLILSASEMARFSAVVYSKASIASFPLEIPLFGWPFLVLAFRAKKCIIAAGLSPIHFRLPLSLGVLELSAPYVFGYGFASPFEFASGAHDAGQGVGIYLGFYCPILGAFGAFLGRVIGVALQ